MQDSNLRLKDKPHSFFRHRRKTPTERLKPKTSCMWNMRVLFCLGYKVAIGGYRQVELQGAQGDREAEVFQVSNDDTAVAQRRLKDKQPEEKTNTDCLVKEQDKEYQTGRKIKTDNFLILVMKASSQEVQTQDLIYYHLARDMEQHLACELFGYREDSNGATFAVAAVEKIYAHESLTFNNTVASTVAGNAVTTSMAIIEAEIWATKGLLAKAKGNILSMEIVRDHSGNTLRVSQSMFYNRKLVQTLLEGHSILLLEGSLSGDCDVEKNESRYELRLVAGIVTGALVKGGFRSEVPAQVEVVVYRY
uniref:Zinc finger, CCHC-type n=1 Tax=Tanacetum cinerariifolium TaxID=118510 RepID=A0A6L2JW46_TANCI|nr:zinc finger, CCHC-type [Tanacetum cinerariifolium]